jgi:putative chitinase
MNLSKLSGLIPAEVISQIPLVMEKFKINTPLRLSHFLAQCLHESGGLKLVNENLNYSAQGLVSTFPKYFTKELAAIYARNPEKIGSRVYANRMGNGAESTKEGFKFKGRGYIQLTGKENYRIFSTEIGEDCVANPDLVATKYPLASAAWFFSRNGLNQISDLGSTIDVVTKVSKRVNGGKKGLNERIAYFNKVYPLLIQ